MPGSAPHATTVTKAMSPNSRITSDVPIDSHGGTMHAVTAWRKATVGKRRKAHLF